MVGPCTFSCILEAAGYTKQGPHLQRPKVDLLFHLDHLCKSRELWYYLTSYPLVTRGQTVNCSCRDKSGSSVTGIVMVTVVLVD